MVGYIFKFLKNSFTLLPITFNLISYCCNKLLWSKNLKRENADCGSEFKGILRHGREVKQQKLKTAGHIAFGNGNQKGMNAGFYSAPVLHLHSPGCNPRQGMEPPTVAILSTSVTTIKTITPQACPSTYYFLVIVVILMGVEMVYGVIICISKWLRSLSIFSCLLSGCQSSLEKSVHSSFYPFLNCIICCFRG